MSKTRKAFLALVLVALFVLGIGLAREWLLPAVAAGQAQPLESDTLFFASGSPVGIRRVSADEPSRLDEQPVSAAADGLQIEAARCEISGMHGSPDGRWIAVDVNCEAGSHTLLLEAATGLVRPAEPSPWHESFFLNWSPDGGAFLLRVDPIGDDLVLLVDVKSGRFERLDVPPFTYEVAFSPDGARVLYAFSRGLGFGSEVWTMDRDGQHRERIVRDPARIVAYARWSPAGDRIAYIRMPDSNVPFTVGELVWADGDGRSARVIAQADAGHGYPPVWSPDGGQVAFVARENPESGAADVSARYLESNIYLADAASGRVRAATRFEGALADGPAWSPDGAWLAFSTAPSTGSGQVAGGVADVWLIEVSSGQLYRVTQSADARHPVWLPGESP
ncbi:MAG: PD40 domain-containing protein [Anaerolineae bacterium]|nr:PD40 domain-containing protein [Anaerolineae bacterium]